MRPGAYEKACYEDVSSWMPPGKRGLLLASFAFAVYPAQTNGTSPDNTPGNPGDNAEFNSAVELSIS
jgi:hypothetical protein